METSFNKRFGQRQQQTEYKLFLVIKVIPSAVVVLGGLESAFV